MDLSSRRISSVEAIEYKHKKFGHVRSSPITSSATSSDETRSIIGYPISCSSNSTLPKRIKTELEDWEPNADNMEPPRTPRKRQRVQATRSTRNKRSASFELCNAPKKCKSEAYSSRSSTPEKQAESSHTLTSFMPKISKETLVRICQYNKNMVRKFPKKERTAKDQERRDKNTIACRMSRRLKKLEVLAVEEQYKIFAQEHFKQYKQSLQAAVYLNELLKFGVNLTQSQQNEEVVEAISKTLGLQYLEKMTTNFKESEDCDFVERHSIQVDQVSKELLEDPRPMEAHLLVQRKRSFSIASLLGTK